MTELTEITKTDEIQVAKMLHDVML